MFIYHIQVVQGNQILERWVGWLSLLKAVKKITELRKIYNGTFEIYQENINTGEQNLITKM